MLRSEKEAGTALGEEAARVTGQGQLVSDAIINAVVSHWLEGQTGNAFVFDGYPRTIGQGEALEGMLAKRQTPLDATLLLEADLDTLRRRVELRAQCKQCRHIVSVGLHVASAADRCPRCGGELIRRQDDNAETLESRFLEYAAKTAPLISFYEKRNLLHRVNTDRPPDEVFAEVREILL